MSSGGVAGVGVRPDQIVNQQEAQQHLAADGKTKLPDDAKAVTVKPGDTISDIMKEHGLDWNNKAQREQFLKDNPQFSDQHPPPTGTRSADLIYPGESVYVRDVAKTKPGDNDGDGKPDPGTPQATDAAAKAYQKAVADSEKPSANKAEWDKKDQEVNKTHAALAAAVKAEIAAGGSADDIIKRLGGPNADQRTVAVVREAATDKAAADYKKALDNYNTGGASAQPYLSQKVQEAKAKLDSAVKAEIRDTAASHASGNSRQEIGKGAINAGESIKARLKQEGITEDDAKAVVDHNAQQVQKDIENEQ